MPRLSDTVRGLSWMGALRGVVRAILFLRIAVLARLLTPKDFGVFGIAALVLAFLEIVTETGINVFLLQRKEIKKYIDSAWIISIVRGFLIGLAIYVFAGPVSGFFRSEAVLPLLYLAVFIPIIRGFINPSSISFQKELHFGKEFFYRVSLVSIEVGVTIYFAFINHSAISLIQGMIASAIFEVVLSFLVFEVRPRFSLTKEYGREILSAGKWVTGYGIFDYLYTQGDNITIGRILGESPLGLYQNAYKLSTLPLSEVNDIFYKATFPIYAKMREKPKELKEAVKRHFTAVSVLMVVGGAILFLFANPIVLIILGPNWVEAIPIVKALSFLGAIRGISFSFNSLFLALHKQHYVTYVTFVSFLVLAVTIIPAVLYFGVIGAAVSAMLGALFAFPFAIYFMRKTFDEI